MTVRATLSAPTVRDDFSLSFNDIIGHTPGRTGRADAKPGKYVNRNGNVLVVYSKNPQLVDCEARANRKRTTKTGKTRTGMVMFDVKKGALRLVACDSGPDGVKNWKPYTGTINI